MDSLEIRVVTTAATTETRTVNDHLVRQRSNAATRQTNQLRQLGQLGQLDQLDSPVRESTFAYGAWHRLDLKEC